jgi:hypothetical protein
MRIWAGFVWLRIGTSEYGDEDRVFIKRTGELIHCLGTVGFSRRTLVH